MRRPSIPQHAVEAVKREFPGIGEIRARQIVRTRTVVQEREQRRRRAALQAAANRYAALPHGGISASAHQLIDSFDHAPLPDEYWLSEGGFDAASLAELS